MEAMLKDYPEFAKYLVEDIASPVLAKGYGDLLSELSKNRELAEIVINHGIDEAFSSNSFDIVSLRKKNKELVTKPEKEAESLIRNAIISKYPDHSIIGEEHGYTKGSKMRWVIDPIDGTSAMIKTAISEAFGLTLPEPAPSFGITIALIDNDEAIFGIITELKSQGGSLKAIKTWFGIKGDSSPTPNIPMNLKDAVLASTVPEIMFNTKEKWGRFQALSEATKTLVTEQNCIGYMRLREEDGGINLVYEADLAYHDAAAIVPILESAGIKVTDEKGARLNFREDKIFKEFEVLAAAPHIHKEALNTIIKGTKDDRNCFKERSSYRGYARKFHDQE